MNRTATLLLLLATAATGRAQFPGQNPNQGQNPGQAYPQQSMPGTAGVAMPPNYRPPLSPYLNLLRGGIPSVNYYNAVRPATIGGGGFGIGAPFTASGGNRQAFFPQLANAPDPLQPREVGVGDVLPPAGHPVVFNNTMGYFTGAGRGGGGMRSGLTGVGTTRPQPRR